MYYDLGSETYQVDHVRDRRIEAETKGDIVRVGVNHHFHPRADRDAAQVGRDVATRLQ